MPTLRYDGRFQRDFEAFLPGVAEMLGLSVEVLS